MGRGPEARPILVVDGDDVARAEVVDLLGRASFDVIEARTGADALEAARETLPCVAILEVPLSDVSGYEVCRELREQFGDDLPIVFLSAARTESYDRVAGLMTGADDYVVKPFAADELLARIRRLVDRSRPHIARAATRLTPRELQVLELLAEGRSPQEIATQLFISRRTVATHVEHIVAKLEVKSRAQAIAAAYREGLVAVPAAR